MLRIALAFCVSIIAAVVGAAPSHAAPADGCPRTAYLSTGDHQDLLWVPLDSAASIDAAFTSLRDRYQVERIWWRGGQDEIWAQEFVFRPENRHYDQIWKWWRHLQFEDVNTNRLAVQTARRLGMKIWLAYGLFDNGSPADVGFSGFPYAAEDRIRAEHPEHAPANRWGTWRQGGPLEFAYPEARRAMVEYLARHMKSGGYDGIAFLTYAENFSQRYEDEFGFSPPIVEEYRRRHGVDPRTQPFDQRSLVRRRGEYLTQFFRELHTALAKENQQIAVCVDGADPELPAPWSHNAARTAGLIHMDVATWAKEGIVDEVTVWAPRDDEARSLQTCRELCRDTRTISSAFRTRGPLPRGTPRVMFLVGEIESGFDWENFIDFDDEIVPLQPESALQDGDEYARRRLLTAVLKQKQSLPLSALVAAARDQDLYVRRSALKALGAAGDQAAISAVRPALEDPEHSVRWQAALTLAELAGGDAIEPLFAAVARDPISYQLRFQALPQALAKLSASDRLTLADKERIVAKLADENSAVRQAALYALLRIGAPAVPQSEATLDQIVRNDADPYAREMALENLRSTFGPTPVVLAAVRHALADPDDAVQVRALAVQARMLGGAAEPALRAQALEETAAFFRRYGEGCTRQDKDWGWRIAGAALQLFGSEGERILQTTIDESKDARLAELAWKVVYLPQGDAYLSTAVEQDRAAHERHPALRDEKLNRKRQP